MSFKLLDLSCESKGRPGVSYFWHVIASINFKFTAVKYSIQFTLTIAFELRH
jgi:hypothetical protein